MDELILFRSNFFVIYADYYYNNYSASITSYSLIVLPLWMVQRNIGNLHNNVSNKMEYKHSHGKSESIKQGVAMPLYEYLSLSVEQYDEFSQFLTTCFALENLLFFVKGIVFRQTVSKIINKSRTRKNNDESMEIEMEEENQGTIEKVFALNFVYLEGLEESCKPNDKVSIQDIAMSIYDEFISVDAKYEVNISADARNKIISFFNTQRQMEEYLCLFDEAIDEVYGMLTCIYRFQFKSSSKYGV